MTAERPTYGRVCVACGVVYVTPHAPALTCSAACAHVMEATREALRRGTLAPERADALDARKAARERTRTEAIELTEPPAPAPRPPRSPDARRRGPRN